VHGARARRSRHRSTVDRRDNGSSNDYDDDDDDYTDDDDDDDEDDDGDDLGEEGIDMDNGSMPSASSWSWHAASRAPVHHDLAAASPHSSATVSATATTAAASVVIARAPDSRQSSSRFGASTSASNSSDIHSARSPRQPALVGIGSSDNDDVGSGVSGPENAADTAARAHRPVADWLALERRLPRTLIRSEALDSLARSEPSIPSWTWAESGLPRDTKSTLARVLNQPSPSVSTSGTPLPAPSPCGPAAATAASVMDSSQHGKSSPLVSGAHGPPSQQSILGAAGPVSRLSLRSSNRLVLRSPNLQKSRPSPAPAHSTLTSPGGSTSAEATATGTSAEEQQLASTVDGLAQWVQAHGGNDVVAPEALRQIFFLRNPMDRHVLPMNIHELSSVPAALQSTRVLTATERVSASAASRGNDRSPGSARVRVVSGRRELNVGATLKAAAMTEQRQSSRSSMRSSSTSASEVAVEPAAVSDTVPDVATAPVVVHQPRMVYGRWYLPIAHWKRRLDSEPLEDPEKLLQLATSKAEQERRQQLDGEVRRLYGAALYRKYLETHGGRLPEFIQACNVPLLTAEGTESDAVAASGTKGGTERRESHGDESVQATPRPASRRGASTPDALSRPSSPGSARTPSRAQSAAPGSGDRRLVRISEHVVAASHAGGRSPP
jgi:hypothetical protein